MHQLPRCRPISDILGYSLDWLVTGRGMPNDQWSAKTTLVPRLASRMNARKKISLEKIEGELLLVPTSLLGKFKGDLANLGIIGGDADLGLLLAGRAKFSLI